MCGIGVLPAAHSGHHNRVMSIAPVNTRLIVRFPRGCLQRWRACVCILLWTHHSAAVTQTHALTERPAHAGEHTHTHNKWSTHSKTHLPQTHSSLKEFLMLLRCKDAHSLTAVYAGNESNPSTLTHPNPHARQASSPSQLTCYHCDIYACWTQQQLWDILKRARVFPAEQHC